MKKTTIKFLSIFAILGLVFISSCIKKDFDAPTDSSTYDPQLSVNKTIADLKFLHSGGSTPILITDDVTISGIIVADDRSGNLYKSIIIQDATGGLPILIGKNSLYNEYPVGRRVYVKCKGLYLGAYGKYVSLGYTPDASGAINDIPTSELPNFVVKGSYPNELPIIKINLGALATPDNAKQYLGCLVEIDSAQFIGPDVDVTFGVSPNLGSATERKVEDCDGNQIIVRTSNYATFINEKTPGGKGVLRGIYSRYNSTAQFMIRDLNDVPFTGNRCGQTTANLVTIKSIRDVFAGSTTNAPAGVKIKGIVISDKSNGNTVSQNITIQDASGGIAVRFTATHSFNLNDEVEINISNAELSEYNGLLQVNNVVYSKATKTGSGLITPKTATIKQVNDSSEVWESSLVKVSNVVLNGTTSVYSGSKTMNDGTGSLTLYTSSAAAFANINYPIGTVSITGIVGQFNTTKQMSLRNTDDVQ